jgi:ATPase subunit of ABC transporter with duplicated ATPase domains
MVTEKQLKNLTPFDKERAREAGKKSKRGKSLKTIIEEISSVEYPTPSKLKAIFPNEKYSGKELMIMAQLAKSYKGDTYAFQAIADRLEGKPKQTLDGEFDNHIQIEIID